MLPKEWWRIPALIPCGDPSGIVANVLDCDLVESEFKLQSLYYILWEPPYLLSYGLNSTTTVLLQGWHSITNKGWYAIKQRSGVQLQIPPPTNFVAFSLWKHFCFRDLQVFIESFHLMRCPDSWSGQIHQLLTIPPTDKCPGYDTKQSDGDVPVMLEFLGMQSTPSLPSLPGPLHPRVVPYDRVLCMGQKELNYELC